MRSTTGARWTGATLTAGGSVEERALVLEPAWKKMQGSAFGLQVPMLVVGAIICLLPFRFVSLLSRLQFFHFAPTPDVRWIAGPLVIPGQVRPATCRPNHHGCRVFGAETKEAGASGPKSLAL